MILTPETNIAKLFTDVSTLFYSTCELLPFAAKLTRRVEWGTYVRKKLRYEINYSRKSFMTNAPSSIEVRKMTK
jgi:hypothetical protein